MNDGPHSGEVALAGDLPASAFLHEVLAAGVAAFPDALAAAALPADLGAFRRSYPEDVPRFEATRLAADDRDAVTLHLVRATQRRIVWREGTDEVPIAEHLAEHPAPLPLAAKTLPGAVGWRPAPVYRGERWDGDRIAELGALLVERGVVTAAAGDALAGLARDVLTDGRLDLRGRRIVVLGAGAEMAPTRLWLEAGADVLWLDVAPPPEDWLASEHLAGRLSWPETPLDLLTQPREALGAILAFADGSPVDLGLYAYAPGRARELRLTGVMNAIVDALPADLVASVTLLVSPTTPTALGAPDLAAIARRERARPAWEGALGAAGLLGRGPGQVRCEDAAAPRTVVSIQGASYQAAQYLGKVLAAECWARHGSSAGPAPGPLRVSANTAAITRTRSLDHPLFAAAFGGAGAFGVETFTPRLSRRLNGLLAVADWLAPEPPTPGAVRVHGGIHTLPFPLEPALRMAAVFGFARSPRLLRGLLPG